MRRSSIVAMLVLLTLPLAFERTARADDGGVDAADDANAAAEAGDDGGVDGNPVPEGIQPTTTPDNLGCTAAPGGRSSGGVFGAACLLAAAMGMAGARRRSKSE